VKNYIEYLNTCNSGTVMAYCPKCRKVIRKGVKFCPKCGTPIGAAAPAKAAEAPVQAPEPTRGAPAPRKMGTTGIIAIVGIIAVVAIVALVLLMMGGGTGLPAYSGAKKLGEQSAEGYTFEFYSFTGSGQGAYNWYKTQMANQGWTLSYDAGYISGYGGALTYTKGSEMALIEVIEDSSTISYYESTSGITVPSGSKLIALMVGPSGL
jgi:hypothetical protein